MILLLSLGLGLGSALFPPLNIEAYLAGLAALHSGPVLWLAVLATTVGHMAGKLLFYALGRGWLLRGLPAWMSRRHKLDGHVVPGSPGTAPGGGVALAPLATAVAADPAAGASSLRRRLARWSRVSRVEALAGRPWATALLCLVSSAVGLPPFALVAVLLGRFRMPVVSFLLVGGLGRLVRFAAVAGLADVVVS